MPPDEQCTQVARIQETMPWVQAGALSASVHLRFSQLGAGTDFFDGSHIVCNNTQS
jgi:hypothetical protein